MSANTNRPAFPTERYDDAQAGCKVGPYPGMTKREYFAGLAMQGMLSVGGPNGHIDGFEDEKCIAALSVKYADALLLALEKSP